KLETPPIEIANLEHDVVPGDAAVDLDEAVAQGREHEVEGLTLVDKRAQGKIERRGRRDIEPTLEIEERVRLARHAEAGGQVSDQKLWLSALAHDQKRLRLGCQHRFERALALTVAIGLCRGARSGFTRPFGRTETGDRGADGKGDDAEIDAEREQR